MITELGHFALILALLGAAVAALGRNLPATAAPNRARISTQRPI